MRRIWFKAEMRVAILNGRKVSTTRYHALPLEEVKAVSGSRFKAEPFAVLRILDHLPTVWREVLRTFYREEGFRNPESMERFGQRTGLLKGSGYLDDRVYYHPFEVVRLL